MIQAKTVFVLGAGAHCPYGLPDGVTLKRKIVEMLSDVNNQNSPFRDCFFHIYSQKFKSIGSKLMEFKSRLALTGHKSIDGFLASTAKVGGFPEIGKLAVARVLLPREFHTDFSITRQINPNVGDQDWMSFLFSYMLERCEHESLEYFLKKNNVSFVTFNYDRTLEHFLHVRLVNSFGISPEIAMETIAKFRIIHVYGSLGKFDSQVLSKSLSRQRQRPGDIGDPFNPSEYKEAAESIRLMYDDRKSDNLIADAQTEISAAEIVIFLGFGFDPANIERLELNKRCENKDVGATRYRVAEGDWVRAIQAMYPTRSFHRTERQWDSLTFLHESSLFR